MCRDSARGSLPPWPSWTPGAPGERPSRWCCRGPPPLGRPAPCGPGESARPGSSRGLLTLLESEPDAQPDLARIADVRARVVSLDQGPAAGLAALEPMLAVAEHRGDPGYALLPAQMTAMELAVKTRCPGIDATLAWFVGYLGGAGADRQVARLQERPGPTPALRNGLTWHPVSPPLQMIGEKEEWL